jgi:prevent-host-death family protein
MKTVSFTEFRSRASGLLTEVEKGEVLVVLRHGRPVAEIGPVSAVRGKSPAWKKPGLKLPARGAGLADAILEERDRADLL